MQETTSLYDQIYGYRYHDIETKFVINGVEYGEDKVFTASSQGSVFGDYGYPVFGLATAKTLNLKIVDDGTTIPKMALVEPYVRISYGDSVSEWLPKGKFHIDIRRVDDTNGIIEFECYDYMVKANAEYTVSSLTWAATDIDVVNEIAGYMGVTVDARTTAVMTHGYTLDSYAGYTQREVLGLIAAMYAGGFIMSDTGELLLVTYAGLPNGNIILGTGATGKYITIGGEAIYVR